MLNALLGIPSFEELFAHPVYGTSWEGVVIENILQKYKKWAYHFYRTAVGSEIDLVLTKAGKIIAIEIKTSPSPKPNKGFWAALDDLKPDETFIIAPVKQFFQ